MDASKQRFLLWLSLAFMVGYSIALIFALHMFPPPSPEWSDLQVQHFYQQHATSIKVGAALASWTGAFLAPFYIVMGLQAARLEKGKPVWGSVIAILGSLMTVFLVFPPIFWGVAAFDADRSADVTALMHQLGCLTLVTTDQYFIFPWLAVVAVCFMSTDVRHSPFPRWFGYATAWSALLFETGAISFATRQGPFAWDGLLTFWLPFVGFGMWMATAYVLLFRALRLQAVEAQAVIVRQEPASASDERATAAATR